MHKKNCLIDVIKRSSGFSFIELMMVMSIIAILLQIGVNVWMDYKRKAYDASAVSDTRNLIEAVVNDMVGAEDVNYDHDPDDGNRIGAFTKPPAEPRKPSLFLSPGVKALIRGGTDVVGTNGITATRVDAFLWHEGGTPWGTTLSGVREFEAHIDEEEADIIFVGFKAN